MSPTYQKFNNLVAPALLLVGIYLFGYELDRANFPVILSVFSIAFFAFLQLQKSTLTEDKIFYIGLAARILLICAVPVLSDDYFRFIWDGKLIQNGYNPFEFTPDQLIDNFQNSPEMVTLWENMNSRGYFTVYPPVNQWIFYISGYFDSIFAGIIVLRLFIIGFEVGTYFVFKKIMERFSLPHKRIGLYWLNPLVIIELTGNLHAEGILVFFLLFALYNFSRLKDLKGGMIFSLSILSKLVSLMILPLLLMKARWFRSKKILLGIIPLLLIAFIPFLNWKNYHHFLSSIELYFRSFQFNGSIFNLIKATGSYFTDIDIVKIAGPILGLVTFLLIIFISLINRYKNRLNLFRTFAVIFSIYLFLSPVVHPWYCIIPLALGVIVNLKYTLAWSALIFLSYSAYHTNYSPTLNTVCLVAEYSIVFFLFYKEIIKPTSWRQIKNTFG